MPTTRSPEYRAFLLRFNRARTMAKLTQVEVAAALKIPRSRVSRMENGERRIDVVELVAFARLYRRRLAWFVET